MNEAISARDKGAEQNKPLSIEAYIKARRTVRASLTSLLLLLFAGFVYLLSWGKDIASAPIAPGNAMNVGIAYSILIIVISFAATAYYAFWTKRREPGEERGQ